ncbi:MAG: hypothetical protein R3E87_18370 [Burkholderiaceae bacterium]
MSHTAALFSGLASLALMSALYYIILHAKQGSWLRNESVPMLLVAILIGFLTMAGAGGIRGLNAVLAQGLSLNAAAAAGADLIALAAVLLSLMVLRAIAVAVRRKENGPASVTPLSPRPAAPGGSSPPLKKAA